MIFFVIRFKYKIEKLQKEVVIMLEDIDFDAIEEEMEINEDLYDYSESEEIESILKEYMSDEEFSVEHEEDEIINMICDE